MPDLHLINNKVFRCDLILGTLNPFDFKIANNSSEHVFTMTVNTSLKPEHEMVSSVSTEFKLFCGQQMLLCDIS